MSATLPELTEALSILGHHAAQADAERTWPEPSWQALCRSGLLAWSIPASFGGQERSADELLLAYAQTASACLTTAFVLSQREAAIRRLLDHGNPILCQELLRPLACGGQFATVGLSQLTTSRQHGPPPLTARWTGDSLVLNGSIPWVTGAAQANYVVIGAVLDDGRQVLAVLPTDWPGVTIGPPLDLMALQGSLTAEVRCQEVRLDRRWILAGPAERVLGGERGGSGGLETSCLALGLAAAAIDFLFAEAAMRRELRFISERLEHVRQGLWQELLQLTGGGNPEKAASLRVRTNRLVLRATQAALTASKGTGFLKNHPAQRWVRQALFFLVWSCPRPVAEAMLADWCADGPAGLFAV